MNNTQKLQMAWAKLTSLHKHPPLDWDEIDVLDYNNNLKAFEESLPGEDLISFRVQDSELKPRPKQIRRRGWSEYSASVPMKAMRYCDRQRMLRRVVGLTVYLLTRYSNASPEPQRSQIGFRS
jgi:hypothetical protein